MPTVAEITGLHAHAMCAPRPASTVCRRCFDFSGGFELCLRCSNRPNPLDAFTPITYSVGHEQMHRTLAGYKRLGGDAGRRLALAVAAILWRFLDGHEACLAAAAGVTGFDLVTTVPSGDAARDEVHPLRTIVGQIVEPTRERHERLLRRSSVEVLPRTLDGRKYLPRRPLSGEAVLIVDDTMTTGASLHNAALALRAAGSGPLGAVVIGRHVNRSHRANDAQLRELLRPFDWTRCALGGRCRGARLSGAGRRPAPPKLASAASAAL